MSDTLVAALIGGVFTIVGSVVAVYLQRHFEMRRTHRPESPRRDRAPPSRNGAGGPPAAAAGPNGKAIAAAAVAVFGLMVGEPAVGLLCAGTALWLGTTSLRETVAHGGKGKGLAWTGMALGALGGFGAFVDMLMPVPSPLMFAPMLYAY